MSNCNPPQIRSECARTTCSIYLTETAEFNDSWMKLRVLHRFIILDLHSWNLTYSARAWMIPTPPTINERCRLSAEPALGSHFSVWLPAHVSQIRAGAEKAITACMCHAEGIFRVEITPMTTTRNPKVATNSQMPHTCRLSPGSEGLGKPSRTSAANDAYVTTDRIAISPIFRM